MKNWHPNSDKHKASHGNYFTKPSKKEVNALLDFYGGAVPVIRQQPVKQQEGAQLKLEL